MCRHFTALVDNGGVGWDYSKPREAFERTATGTNTVLSNLSIWPP